MYKLKDRAWRRKTDIKKAIRKKKLSDAFMGTDSQGNQYHWYPYLHQYSKGKIHCSCPLCRKKTKSSHRGLSWEGNGKYDYKISELKQQQSLDDNLYDYLLDNGRDATQEEQESINNYIRSISKPTKINFWDLVEKNNDYLSEEEYSYYKEQLEKNSIDLGINIYDLFDED